MSLFHAGLQPAIDEDGNPISGAQWKFYLTGTTTPTAVYSDSAFVTSVGATITADAAGRFDPVFLDEGVSYRAKLLDAGGATLNDIDPANAEGAGGSQSFTFDEIATTAIPTGVTVFQTSGKSEAGTGAAWYVEDDLADQTLVDTYPNLAAKSQNNRFFRLLPINGLIEVEQAGAVGDPNEAYTQNDQAAVQEAIDYLEEVQGYSRIGWTQRHYTVFATERTTTLATYPTYWAEDGHPIVVRKPAEFVNLTGGIVTISYRNYGGGSFQSTTPGTGFQVVGGRVFRGFAIYLKGADVDPGIGKRSSFKAKGFTFNGGTTSNMSVTWPADATTGINWDIWHKGIGCQPDVFVGGIDLEECEVDGFRGEAVYTTNKFDVGLRMVNCKVIECNAQPINPASGWTEVEGLYAQNCSTAMEGWGGYRGYIRGVFENCGTGVMSGGTFTQGAAQESRTADGLIPTIGFDVELRSCDPFYPGPWLKGKIKAIDTQILVEATSVWVNGNCDTALDIESWVDAYNSGLVAVQMIGPPTLTTYVSGSSGPYKQPLHNLHYTLRTYRTRAAEVAGYYHTRPITYYGYIDASSTACVIEDTEAQLAPVNASTFNGMPLFNIGRMRQINYGGTTIRGGVSVNVSSNLDIRSPIHSLTKTGTGTQAVTLNAPGTSPYTFADGQEVLLVHNGAATTYFTFSNQTYLKVNAPRVLAAGGDWIKLRYRSITPIWEEVGFFGSSTPPIIPTYTVANLPTYAMAGMLAQVTDSNATTQNAIVAGGGANVVLCLHDGTNWRIA